MSDGILWAILLIATYAAFMAGKTASEVAELRKEVGRLRGDPAGTAELRQEGPI